MSPTARKSSLSEKVLEGVCKRAFSSPEAFAYELAIAPALARVVEPIVSEDLAGRVLDVGCGSGLLLAELFERYPVTEAVGIDPSASEMRRISRRSPLNGVQASAGALPFRAGTFDVVISSCAWKHWPDPELGVGECVRVLRPGGRLVLVEIDGAARADEFRRFARLSRVPPGIREAYVRFAMRTVVGVAPRRDRFAESVENPGLVDVAVRRASLPFLVATARRGPYREAGQPERRKTLQSVERTPSRTSAI